MRGTADNEQVVFAHPVEQEFARALDDVAVPWLYEPHTFVLARHDDGSVASAFTPDFYLPDQELYLECTVARPKLLREKKRKAKAAQRMYGIAVLIVFRADFERLARRWSLGGLERALATRCGPCNGAAPESRGRAASSGA